MNPDSVQALPSHFRAWRWQQSDNPLDLTLETMPLLTPEAGQVLVRNAVIGLNPVDWKVLDHSVADWQRGHIPGVDGAGEVVAIGPGVASDWLGRRVAYHTSLHQHGSFAEFTQVPMRALLRIPHTMGFEVAASAPCPALTAWLAIEKVPVQAEAPLLISGAGGAVGNYLLQFATARGFAVTAMADPRHWERLRALGARECVDWTGYGGTSVVAVRHFYAVIDSVNEQHATHLGDLLRANGHMVCIQGRVPQWLCPPFGLTLSMHEVALGGLHVYGDDDAWSRLTQAGERVLEQIDTGGMQPERHIVREFNALPRFLNDLKHRNFSGKGLVRV